MQNFQPELSEKAPAKIWVCFIAFLVGSARYFDLDVGARITLSEVIAFLSIPVLLKPQALMARGSCFRGLILIFALWVAGIVVSDLINDSPFVLFLKGAMKPVFCLLWFCFFCGLFLRGRDSLLFLIAGMLVGALQNFFLPQGWAEEHVLGGAGYNFVAYAYTPIFVEFSIFASVVVFLRSKTLSSAFLIAGGLGVILVGGQRSVGALFVLSGILICFSGQIFSLPKLNRRNILYWFFPIAFISIAVAYGIFELYTWAAFEGLLGEFQYQKLHAQSMTTFGDSPLGLILAGRSEVYGAVLAIMDRPLIGYGSWSGALMRDYLYEAYVFVGDSSRLNGNFGGVGHSLLFSAWMENGILAGMAFVLIILVNVRVLLQSLLSGDRFAPYVVCLCVAFCWQFFFSPFGVTTRLWIGFIMATQVFYFDSFGLRRQSRQIKQIRHRWIP